jgi:hypothetical protein
LLPLDGNTAGGPLPTSGFVVADPWSCSGFKARLCLDVAAVKDRCSKRARTAAKRLRLASIIFVMMLNKSTL